MCVRQNKEKSWERERGTGRIRLKQEHTYVLAAAAGAEVGKSSSRPKRVSAF